MKDYAGEYPQPLARTALPFHMTVVSGFVTGRLRSQPNLFPNTSVTDQLAEVLLENVGLSDFDLQLKETNDRAATGSRTNIGSAVSLVAGGRTTISITPTKKYLEVWGTDGEGELRGQISSQIRWDVMGFDKANDIQTGLYPSKLSQPLTIPSADLP